MACRFPHRASQQRIPGRECPRRALAMHPDIAELRMPFLLYEVMTDLVKQIEVEHESFAKGFGNLLENDQAVQDCIVAAGSDRIQIIAIVFRIRSEVAEIDILDLVRPLSPRQLEIVRRHAVTKT